MNWYTLKERWPQESEHVLAVIEGDKGQRRCFKTWFTYKPYEMESACFIDGFYINDTDMPSMRYEVICWAPIDVPDWALLIPDKYDGLRYALTK